MEEMNADDFKKHLPRDMQSGMTKRATATGLRRLCRAKRIAAGLRPEKYSVDTKREATIRRKVAATGIEGRRDSPMKQKIVDRVIAGLNRFLAGA